MLRDYPLRLSDKLSPALFVWPTKFRPVPMLVLTFLAGLRLPPLLTSYHFCGYALLRAALFYLDGIAPAAAQQHVILSLLCLDVDRACAGYQSLQVAALRMMQRCG